VHPQRAAILLHRHSTPTCTDDNTRTDDSSTERTRSRATTLPPPHNILSPASRDHHTNTLNPTDTINKISEHLRQPTLQQQELRTIAMAIANGMVAQPWSLDQGLLLFDGHLYLPMASSLLSNCLQVLSRDVLANMEFLALGAHQPLTYGQHNGVPWLQRPPSTDATVVFLKLNNNTNNVRTYVLHGDTIGLHWAL
jgi:hypothetical protein